MTCLHSTICVTLMFHVGGVKEVARRSKTAKLVAKADMGCLFGQNVQVFLW